MTFYYVFNPNPDTWSLRADAYQQLNDGTPDGMVKRCETFLDALIWMAGRPESPPDVLNKVHYPRPPLTSTSNGRQPAKRRRITSEPVLAEGLKKQGIYSP